MNHSRITFLLAALLLLSACHPATQPQSSGVQPSTSFPPKRVTLTEADNGRRLTLSVGDTLAVVLPSNPSTDYSWEIERLSQDVLESAGSVQQDPATVRLGGGGEVLFLFNVVQQGQTTLRLVYHRPFEQAEPEKTFELHLTVP